MAGFRKPEVPREQLTLWSLLCTAVNVGILLRHWPEVMKVL